MKARFLILTILTAFLLASACGGGIFATSTPTPIPTPTPLRDAPMPDGDDTYLLERAYEEAMRISEEIDEAVFPVTMFRYHDRFFFSIRTVSNRYYLLVFRYNFEKETWEYEETFLENPPRETPVPSESF